MRIDIVTKNEESYSSAQLRKALARRNIPSMCFSLPQFVANVGFKPAVRIRRHNLKKETEALIVRPIGRGSLEELIFRMDMLYRLERSGLYIVNAPEAIEHCVDKYDILAILEENGLPVPRTVVTEHVEEALESFTTLGGDIIVKPIFGSRGVGATRVNDKEIAYTMFKAIRFYHGVIYMQEFVPHGHSDIRAFVVGDRVVASMRRVARTWKTNYSQGARPEKTELNSKLEKLAVKSAKSVECKIAGVDILESPKGPVVVDVNSQPGWKGLQSITRLNIADEIVKFVLTELKR